MPKQDLSAYAAQLSLMNNRHAMQPVIEKELLHYEILSALEEAGMLAGLVFQGGTCLRLCYGAHRYSEDLDFAGGRDFDSSNMDQLKQCLEKTLAEKYLVSLAVKEPANTNAFVKKWRIVVDTAPERPDIPAQKISLEVAAIPAYTKRPRMLQLNYEGLMQSYADTILNTESLEEIMADKLESYICSAYIRYRDLWDLQWLLRQPNIDIDEARALRELKEADYNETERFKVGLTRAKKDLHSIVESTEFKSQMKRFLPTDLFEKTIENQSFRTILKENIAELYSRY